MSNIGKYTTDFASPEKGGAFRGATLPKFTEQDEGKVLGIHRVEGQLQYALGDGSGIPAGATENQILSADRDGNPIWRNSLEVPQFFAKDAGDVLTVRMSDNVPFIMWEAPSKPLVVTINSNSTSNVTALDILRAYGQGRAVVIRVQSSNMAGDVYEEAQLDKVYNDDDSMSNPPTVEYHLERVAINMIQYVRYKLVGTTATFIETRKIATT